MTAIIVFIFLVLLSVSFLAIYFRQKKKMPDDAIEAKQKDEPVVYDEETNSLTTLTIDLSGQDSGKYKLSTSSVTCTCPDFEKRRKFFRKDDPQRLCKHLILLFNGKDVLPPLFEPYRHTISLCTQNGFGFPISKKIIYEDFKVGKIELWIPNKHTDENGWCDVYVNSVRFGYNILEQRWSYDSRPPMAREIKKIIRSEY